MKIFLLLLTGYVLHMSAIEVGNLSYEYRWIECVVRMHKKEVPNLHPKGGHYCLTYMKTPTLLEEITGYAPNLWKIYEEKIGKSRLSKAYDESKGLK